MRYGRLLAIVCLWMPTSCVAAQELPEGAVARLGVHRFRARTPFVNGCGVTPDSGTVVVVDRHGQDYRSGDIVFYDIDTGRETARLGISNAQDFVVARDRPRMLLSTPASFKLWDLANKVRLRTWPIRFVNPNSAIMAISPCGTQFVASVNSWNTLRWNEDSPTMSQLMQKLTWRHAFSDDGSKLFCIRTETDGYNSVILVFDARTNRQLAEWKYNDGLVALSPCGTRVARGSHGKAIRVGPLDHQKDPDIVIPGAHAKCYFTHDGKHLLLCPHNGNPARLWDIAGNKEVRAFHGLDRNMLPTPDGKRIVATASGVDRPVRAYPERLYVWDMTTGKRVRIPGGHPFHVGGLAYAPDGKRLASFSHDTIVLFDPFTGKEIRQWIAQPAAITQVAFSPDGKLLASAAEDGTIALWDPDSGQQRRRIHAVRDVIADDKPGVRAIAFSYDGKTLTACVGVTLQTWDLDQGELLRKATFVNANFGHQLAFTGRYAAAAVTFPYESFLLPIAHVPSGRSRPPLDSGKTNQAVAFSPDGNLLATSNVVLDPDPASRSPKRRHSVRIWETFSRREIVRCTGLPACPQLLAISPDNRTLVHSMGASLSQYGEPGTALMFRDLSHATAESLGQDDQDLEHKAAWLRTQRLLPLTVHHGTVITLAFSPDGSQLATDGSDGVIYIWSVAHFHRQPLPAQRQAELAKLWGELAGSDAATAHRAIAQMESTPQESIAFLRRHFQPPSPVDEKPIREHLRGIHSERFIVRQQAIAALDKAGDDAIEFIRQELAKPIALESRRRLAPLLEQLEDRSEIGPRLRSRRALMLLRRIGTPEARTLVEELARSTPSTWLSEEAACTLSRWNPAPPRDQSSGGNRSS